MKLNITPQVKDQEKHLEILHLKSELAQYRYVVATAAAKIRDLRQRLLIAQNKEPKRGEN